MIQLVAQLRVYLHSQFCRDTFDPITAVLPTTRQPVTYSGPERFLDLAFYGDSPQPLLIRDQAKQVGLACLSTPRHLHTMLRQAKDQGGIRSEMGSNLRG